MNDIETREIKAIVCETVKQSTPQAVRETLELFGVDVKNPRETQADMLFLRKIRGEAQGISYYIKRSMIWGMITLIALLCFEAIKFWLMKIRGE